MERKVDVYLKDLIRCIDKILAYIETAGSYEGFCNNETEHKENVTQKDDYEMRGSM